MGRDPKVNRGEHSVGWHILLKSLFYFKATLIALQLYCIKPRLHLRNKENMFSEKVATGYISVWPVDQHQRPIQLLQFTSSV
jgi:hypothetical protein